MDLAGGHVLCLEQIDRNDIFENQASTGSGFGGSGGNFRAFNVSGGRAYTGATPCRGLAVVTASPR